MEIKEHIKSFISIHTDIAVYNRGVKLYKQDTVNFIGYVEKSDLWDFQVKGSRVYHIKIKGIKKQGIDSSCTCPYDWGTLCKHQIAALLYIMENNGVPPTEDYTYPVKQIHYRLSPDDFYEIDEYNPLTEKWVFQNTDSHIYNTLQYKARQAEIDKFEVLENIILIHVSIDFNKYSVVFRNENGKIFVSSSEKGRTSKLKLSEAYCLMTIIQSENPDLLNNLLINDSITRKKETLLAFGLPEDSEFEDYFKYDFTVASGLVVTPTELASGLLPINNEFSTPILDFIEKKASDLPALPELGTALEKRTLGFVIRFNNGYYNEYLDNDYYRNNIAAEIVPIVGKPNKTDTALSAHIEEYTDHFTELYDISIPDSTKETLRLIELLDSECTNETQFQYRKAIFQQLVNEKHVYTIKKFEYEIKKSFLEPLVLSPDEFSIAYQVSNKSGFIQSDLKISLNNKQVVPGKINKNRSDNTFISIDGICYCAKNYSANQGLKENPGPLKMVQSHKDYFFEKVILPLSKNYDIILNKGTYKHDAVELDFHKKQVYLSEQNGYLIITPHVVYDKNTNIPLYNYGSVLTKSDDTVIEYKRNHELEEDFIDQISELHPHFELHKSKRIFYLHMNEFVENMWFYNFFDQLTNLNIDVFGLKDLKGFKYSPYKGKISTTVSSGEDWFEINLDISFGNNTVSLKDIRKAILNKEQYIRLKDGAVGVMPAEWFRKLEKYFRNGEIRDNKLEISKLRFSIIDELFDDIDDTEILLELAEKKQRLSNFTEISKTQIPKEITADLRHYQKEGLNWLNFLDEMKWGGILADDMGLGKTLQILTFIQHLAATQRSTHLVVVPTTLLFNWENEIKKFAPNLKALYHYGTKRANNTKGFEKYDLVFTTYGILLRDIKMLCTFRFNYVILDESQAIKNPSSRRYKAANLIQASNRLALSGTPIENSTFDLFAQMNFVNRGLFGSIASFKEHYSNPIDKEGNDLMASELQRIVSPFILRRTKERVASELPPKTEDVIYCEMESEQRKVYDGYRNDFRNQILNTIDDQGIQKSKLKVLEALTRLRQICDSPQLLNSGDIDCNESVKIKEILRHITNKTANHKILIFSQFVQMLSLVKNEMDKLNIKYEYLDGKCTTTQRKKSVNNFQEDENLRVFLISLKAGGTGLNLTAADYVYIIDPWWNPAVENQAIDRCYRIGQNKKVFAYRMICKNTIEEKIMNLQQKKNKIAGDIIQTDENIMKTITEDDIKELLS